MTSDFDKLAQKIKSLLTLADRATNPHEAAAAAEAAAKLIQKYNLDADSVRDWTAPPEITEERVILYYLTPDSWKRTTEDKDKLRDRRNGYRNPYGRRTHRRGPKEWPPAMWYEYGQTDWFVSLAHSVARLCECRAPIYSPGSVVFIGRKDNVRQAAFLISNIFSRMLVMADQAVKDYARDYKEDHGISPYKERGRLHPSKFRLGWLNGCASAFTIKMRERNLSADFSRPAQPAAQTNALVALKKAIDLYIEDRLKGVKDMSPDAGNDRLGSTRGIIAGMEAGKSFALQDGVGAGSARAALTGSKDE